MWRGRRKNESSVLGWTNYTPCFPAEVQTLLGKVYDDEAAAQLKFEIAQNTRYLEIIGFSASLLTLLMSLFIFTHFRTLRNNRTRIHRNLILAMTIQVIIRLVVYFDQAFFREKNEERNNSLAVRGIDNVPYLCEACYVLLEYAISAMFTWMFIEGLYLHNVVTANVLRDNISYNLYCGLGWGLPAVFTTLWAVMAALHYQADFVSQCWYGYNFLLEYWIVQGPRLAVILINLVFLLNIMRVLIMKLRRSDSTEIEKVRKAVRAAMVLLPLLGITNILNVIEPPLDGSVWKFGLWSYTTHFLRSFQGFFIALIYCFLNGEVRQVLKRHYNDWRATHNDERRQRESATRLSSGNRHGRSRLRSWLPLQSLNWMRRGHRNDNMVSDFEFGIDSQEQRRASRFHDSVFLHGFDEIKTDGNTDVTENV